MSEAAVYLGLGSNVGDRAANLRAAAAALSAAGVEIVARASLYETAPQGEVTDQPDFLNSALKVRTALAPLELLDLCKRIENELGRESGGVRHGPRLIDIDVLLVGDLVHGDEPLSLPHREIATRHFVLAPLLELDPDLTLPDGTLADSLLAAVMGQPVERAGEF
ncbi:MAG: 2-amino-4-hydroxy-6-hydroxymethyldihydropteridine diphosphokinase [Thermoleophilia bacterium]|nr:2-amino-4-hydroxy-6-hydroxymethyldihydropteridine diphosphokinase [Thermoleophilia bacterium]